MDNAIDEAANGYASEITVTLKKDGSCVVTDNGRGFDPTAHPGPAEGHFGIDGIRDRLNRLNGRLTYTSRPGFTHARFEIPFPRETSDTQPHT